MVNTQRKKHKKKLDFNKVSELTPFTFVLDLLKYK